MKNGPGSVRAPPSGPRDGRSEPRSNGKEFETAPPPEKMKFIKTFVCGLCLWGLGCVPPIRLYCIQL